MRATGYVALALIAASYSALAQTIGVPGSGGASATVVSQSCGPVSGVIGGVNQSVTLSSGCQGVASYIIDVTPTAGSPLVGTLSAVDSQTGGGRIMFKAGVGQLGVYVLPFAGVAGTTYEYRVVGGGYGVTLTASSYTSGSATVSILGSTSAAIGFVNGSVATNEEVSVQQGRAFSVSSGNQSLANGNYENLLISNPSTSMSRLIMTDRTAYCDSPTGNVAPKWYSISDPTVNLPTGVMSITNRKTGGPASVATAVFNANVTTYPDTSPVTALTNRVGGVVPTGGGTNGGPGTIIRTIEPGHSYAISILGSTATGLTANPICGINFVYSEQPLQ